MYSPGRADLELRGVRPHKGSQQLDRVVPAYVVLQRIYSCCSTLYMRMQQDTHILYTNMEPIPMHLETRRL